MNKIPENKIIQTPSHLGLFEKDTNIKPLNIREAMATNSDRKKLTEAFFSNANQTLLKNNIKKQIKISSLHDEEHVNVVISNIFMNNTNNHNISYTIQEINNIVLTNGIEQIKASLSSQQQFLIDRNKIGGFLQNPVVTSNKIERQLPRSNFI